MKSLSKSTENGYLWNEFRIEYEKKFELFYIRSESNKRTNNAVAVRDSFVELELSVP